MLLAATSAPVNAETPAVNAITVSHGTIEIESRSVDVFYSIAGTDNGHVVLDIYSPGNEKVRTIDCGYKSTGSYVVTWDGKNNDGWNVPNGIYRLQITVVVGNYASNAKWGGYGTADGQFKRPSGIAVDRTGNVIVAEYDNHRVQKFDSSGGFLGKWGTKGAADGQFNYPMGIAVSRDGTVYVVDYGNSRIQAFTSNGGFLFKWGSPGSGNGQFKQPRAIAIDRSGIIYVADSGNNRIQKFGPNGDFIGAWECRGTEGTVASPVSVAVDGTGIVYVTGAGIGQVLRFTSDGTYLGETGNWANVLGQQGGMARVATNGGSRVIISDIASRRVLEFDTSGSLSASLGMEGLNSPDGIAVDAEGSVYITDISGHFVQKLTFNALSEEMVASNGTSVEVNMLTGKEKRLYRMEQPDGGLMNGAFYSLTPDSRRSTYIVVLEDGPQKMLAASIGPSSMDQVASAVTLYNGTIVARYDTINGMAVTMSDDDAEKLAELDNVKYIEMEQQYYLLLDRAVPQIRGDQVWAEGYSGRGVKVAVIDSGVDASHPDLDEGKVIAWVDYVGGRATPYDDHGHGTHVSSTIAGTGEAEGGKYRGVAPNSSLMAAKAFNILGTGSTSDIIDAIEWAVENHADVISMSFGGPHSQAMDDAVNSAIGAGITCVISAGNNGPTPGTIGCPGDNINAITVGAVNRADVIADFSSRGPNYDGSVKPDVTNMGVGLVAARAAGTWMGIPVSDYYTAASGTSMAAPMTSGVVALLLEAQPDLTPFQVKMALQNTAAPLGGSVPNNDYGYGRVDAKAALDYVQGESPTPSPNKPIEVVPAPPMQGPQYTGGVSGRVTTQDPASGVADAYVAIVNASNTSQAYYVGTSGLQGYFEFADVNSTYNSTTGQYEPRYKLYATKNLFGEGYSNNFTVERNSTAAVNVIIAVPAPTPIPTPTPTPTPPLPPEPDKNQPPSTIITLTGQPGNNSWYLSDVTVTLSAQDKSGTGIKLINYSFDNQSWITYTTPFSISSEGTTTIRFYAVDNASHRENTQSANVRLDKTPPRIWGGATTSPISNGWYRGTVIVHYEANDTLSGLDSVTPDQAISTSGPNQVVIGTAIDKAGNKATHEVGLNIDNDAPVSACTAVGDAWSKSDVQVGFSATDNDGSGVMLTEYSLGGGTWKPAVPIIISEEGMTTIYYRSVDQVGNEEVAQSSIVKLDKTPPIITGAPLGAPGFGGWYGSDVTVHFTATDALSDIASVSPDVTLEDEGAHQSVMGSATDKAGNTANTIVSGINIDKSPPVTSCTLEGEGGGTGDNVWYRSDVNVTLTASDGSGIGVKDTEYRIDFGPWTPYTGHFNVTKEGISRVYFRSEDMLGKVEYEKAREVKIDRIAPSIDHIIIGPYTMVDGEKWYTDTAVVHFTGTDDKSGVGSVTPDIYLSADGYNQSVTGYVTDMAGNVMWRWVFGINIDRNAPTTMCTLDPEPNEDGWLNRSTSVSLKAFDDLGKGSNRTQYNINGTPWTDYDGEFTVPYEGVNVVYYRSIDNVSHSEPVNARNVKIDFGAPVITPVVIGGDSRTITAGESAQYWYTENVTVHFEAYDAISGIKYVTPDRLLSEDGANITVNGTALDFAGNDNAASITVNLDRNAPMTDCLISGTQGLNGWYRSAVTVTLSATENGSGLNYTLYSTDNVTWEKYTQPLVVNAEGNTTVYYYSVDKINNTEPISSRLIKIDTWKPIIFTSRTPDPNSNGWYSTNVTATAYVKDVVSGPYLEVINKTIGTEGAGQYVVFDVMDGAGNFNSTLVSANIDRTVPNTTCKLDGVRGNSGWYGSDTKVSFSVADVPGAAITTYFRYVGSDQNLTYSGPFTITSPGEYTIKYYSIDGAGNRESERSTSFKIDKTLPSITCKVDGTMGSDGWYRSDVTVSFNASDPGPSGLAKAEYSLDGTTWKPVETVTLSNEGLYSIRYRATNNAGTQVNGEKSIGIIKTSPRVVNYTPESDAVGVFVDSQVKVNFEGRMNASTVTPESFYLTDGSEKVDAIVRCDQNGTAVLQPLSGLYPETIYTVHVTEGVTDLAGNSVAGAPEWSFTTGSYSSSGEVTVTIRPPTPTPVPSPTATPVPRPTTESTGLGWLPIALAVIAIVVIGGAVALYIFVIRK